jgi:hypothetical protein
LTIRIKVAEPQILAKLHEQLLEPGTLAYILKAVEREAKKAAAATPSRAAAVKRLEQERRKLQNLVSALEGGSPGPAAVLKAIAEREKAIGELEAQVRAVADAPTRRNLSVSSDWVKHQLSDLAGLLKEDVPRVKAELRRLNLALTFTPTDAAPRPHYVVKGQCDLSALVFSFVQGADRGRGSLTRLGAVVDLSREEAAVGRPDRYAPALLPSTGPVTTLPCEYLALFLCLQPAASAVESLL